MGGCPAALGAPDLAARHRAANGTDSLFHALGTAPERKCAAANLFNGRLQSAPEPIYDSFILRELDTQPDEFKEAHAIGALLGKYQLGIGDVWIALRIEQFIQEGMFEVLTTSDTGRSIYRHMLRRSVTPEIQIALPGETPYNEI